MRSVYPFSAIVGQHEMKLALVLNVIDPAIGGALIMGHRGTGKSTAIRGLAELLPEIEVVQSCAYRCDPVDLERLCNDCAVKLSAGKLRTEYSPVRVIDLPLGATEDRLCGTIDLEQALRAGAKSFEPGLLALANRGFLYIDEVNLLEDHLVNILLDAAAAGRNRVERESISVEHPSRFVLIGSGNPEEGELRPQLQDRFGFHIEITTDNDLESRVEVVKKRDAFERAPRAFCISVEAEQERLRKKISKAQKTLADVNLDNRLLHQIAQLCSDLKIDGHRGELTIARASRALAAFENRKRVVAEDVKRVAVISLRHRLRREALDETGSTERIMNALERVFSSSLESVEKNRGGSELLGDQSNESDEKQSSQAATANSRPSANRENGSDGKVKLSDPPRFDLELPDLEFTKRHRSRDGRFERTRNSGSKSSQMRFLNPERGRYTQAVDYKTARVAVDATLRVAARKQSVKKGVDSQILITADSLRYKLFARKSGSLFIVALDTSGSMAFKRIAQAKGAVMQLLKRSYLNRDRVAIVSFGGTEAKLLLPPTRSILRAKRILDSLSVGGGTPLAAALLRSLELARRTASQDTETVLLLFTDGRANVPTRSPGNSNRQTLIKSELRSVALDLKNANVKTVLFETQNRFTAKEDLTGLAEILSGELVQLKPLFIEKAAGR